MRLDNLHGYGTIEEYVKYKLDKYSAEEKKDLGALFRHMFDEETNVMAETSDGYRIKRITYGQFKENILRKAPTVARSLAELEKDSLVGLYMSNSVEWLEAFWAILAAGYRPLLMNSRLPDAVLEGILAEYNVGAVITDSKTFSVPTLAKDEVLVDSGEKIGCDGFGTEVIFMSSGTTDSVKLCAYTGENFYYQICDSVNILRECPEIGGHYEGELKQLALLPFYHVFGFIAVYLWFAFFSRTFVFPRDLTPMTIQNTVRKHKVTHIFAVPMVWERVYKAAIGKIRSKGEKTLARFGRVSRFVNSHGKIGTLAAKRLLREVREGLFGDSIKFLISGGSHISPEVLEFYNGIGYHMANGYGMTEIGITSVESTSKRKILNTSSIGAPFGYTEYKVGEGGELLVCGRTMASYIMQGGTKTVTDFESFFATRDLVRCEGGRYYIDGRRDDLIVGSDGENLNPVIAEAAIRVEGIEQICIYADASGAPILIANIPCCFSGKKLRRIWDDVRAALVAAKLDGVIKRILFTHESLMREGEIKISRRRVAERVGAGGITTFDPRGIDEHVERLRTGLESAVRDCFARALGREADAIGLNDGFFTDLDGTSLDYFSLLGIIKERFGIDVLSGGAEKFSTVSEFSDYIKNS